MIQAAIGGYEVFGTSGFTSFTDAPNSYYEPGFSIMFPLEFSLSKSDIVYVLLRKRTDETESTFDAMDIDSLSISIKDSSNGRSISHSVLDNNINTNWNTSEFDAIVIKIQLAVGGDESEASTARVRAVDCFVKDTSKKFISFRIKISDDSQPFAFLHLNESKISQRPKTSSLATGTILQLSEKGSYVLLSPLATFRETTPDNSNFSYPPDSIYYKKQNILNNETYNFTISGFSHTEIEDGISITPVPGYHGVGVLKLDAHLKTIVASLDGILYIDINATSRETGSEDNFRLYLSRFQNKTLDSL